MDHFFTCFLGFIQGLKSDGHGNGGTHYHLSIQEIIIHHISVVYINIYFGNPF